MEVDNITLGSVGVGPRAAGEAVFADEGGVDIVQDVRPDLTDVVHLT